VPDSAEPRDNNERLALIQRLWRELQAASADPQKYQLLIKRIRREADAFREALDREKPPKP